MLSSVTPYPAPGHGEHSLERRVVIACSSARFTARLHNYRVFAVLQSP